MLNIWYIVTFIKQEVELYEREFPKITIYAELRPNMNDLVLMCVEKNTLQRHRVFFIRVFFLCLLFLQVSKIFFHHQVKEWLRFCLLAKTVCLLSLIRPINQCNLWWLICVTVGEDSEQPLNVSIPVTEELAQCSATKDSIMASCPAVAVSSVPAGRWSDSLLSLTSHPSPSPRLSGSLAITLRGAPWLH